MVNIIPAYFNLAKELLSGPFDPIATKRLAICISNTCGHYNSDIGVCKKCLCPCRAKVYCKSKDCECPEGLWKT